jgi:hypothetical protein
MARRRIVVAALAAALAASRVAAAPEAGAASVTGEIVDSACWIKSGARGESHRACAQKCADVGIPLALVEDGSGTLVWLFSIDDMQTPNPTLRPHAGRKVRVTGTWKERGGARILLVSKVEPAGK